MAFKYQLKHPDGTPVEPSSFTSAIPTWWPGDTIPLRPEHTLRVIAVQPGDEPGADDVLVVEPV